MRGQVSWEATWGRFFVSVVNKEIRKCIDGFVEWLGSYGETSYDHQTFFAGPIGRWCQNFVLQKPGFGHDSGVAFDILRGLCPFRTISFLEKAKDSLSRMPIMQWGLRCLQNWSKKKYYYDRAVHFLGELKKSRSRGYQHYCWGYPFDWVTRNGTIPANTPFITTLPYVYEAFEYVHQLDKRMRSG